MINQSEQKENVAASQQADEGANISFTAVKRKNDETASELNDSSKKLLSDVERVARSGWKSSRSRSLTETDTSRRQQAGSHDGDERNDLVQQSARSEQISVPSRSSIDGPISRPQSRLQVFSQRLPVSGRTTPGILTRESTLPLPSIMIEPIRNTAKTTATANAADGSNRNDSGNVSKLKQPKAISKPIVDPSVPEPMKTESLQQTDHSDISVVGKTDSQSDRQLREAKLRIESLEKALKTSEKERLACKEQLNTARVQLEVTNGEFDQLVARTDHLQRTLQEVEQERDSLKQEVSHRDGRQLSQAERVEEDLLNSANERKLEAENLSLLLEVEHQKKKVENLEASLEELKGENEIIQFDLAESKSDNAKLRKELAANKTKLEEVKRHAKGQLVQAEQFVNEQKEVIARLEKREKTLIAEGQSRDEALRNLSFDVSTKSLEIQDLRLLLEQAKNEAVAAETEKQKLTAALRTAEANLRDSFSSREKEMFKFQAIQKEFKVTEQKLLARITALQSEVAGLQAQLKSTTISSTADKDKIRTLEDEIRSKELANQHLDFLFEESKAEKWSLEQALSLMEAESSKKINDLDNETLQLSLEVKNLECQLQSMVESSTSSNEKIKALESTVEETNALVKEGIEKYNAEVQKLLKAEDKVCTLELELLAKDESLAECKNELQILNQKYKEEMSTRDRLLQEAESSLATSKALALEQVKNLEMAVKNARITADTQSKEYAESMSAVQAQLSAKTDELRILREETRDSLMKKDDVIASLEFALLPSDRRDVAVGGDLQESPAESSSTQTDETWTCTELLRAEIGRMEDELKCSTNLNNDQAVKMQASLKEIELLEERLNILQEERLREVANLTRRIEEHAEEKLAVKEQLNKEMADLRHIIEEMEREKNSTSATLFAVKEELINTKTNLCIRDQEIDETLASIDSLEKRITELQEERNSLHDDNVNLKELAETFSVQQSDSRLRLEKSLLAESDLKEKLAELEEQLSELESERFKTGDIDTSAIVTLEQRVAELELMLSSSHEQTKQTDNLLAVYQQALQLLEIQPEDGTSVQDEVRKKVDHFTSCDRNLQLLQQRYDDQEAHAAALVVELETTADIKRKLESKLEEEIAKSEHLQTLLRTAENERSDLRARLNKASLEEAEFVSALGGFDDEVEKLLAQVNQLVTSPGLERLILPAATHHTSCRQALESLRDIARYLAPVCIEQNSLSEQCVRDLETANEKCKALADSLETCNSQVELQRARIMQLETLLSETEKSLESCKQELAEAQASFEAKFSTNASDLRAAHVRLEEVLAERESLQCTVNVNQEELNRLRDLRRSLEVSNGELTLKVQELTLEGQHHREAAKIINDDLAEVKTENDRLMQENTKLAVTLEQRTQEEADTLSSAKDEIESLQRQLKERIVELESSQSKSDDDHALYEATKAENVELRSDIERVQLQVQDLTRDLEGKELKLSLLDEELKSFASNKTELLDKLVSQERALEEEAIKLHKKTEELNLYIQTATEADAAFKAREKELIGNLEKEKAMSGDYLNELLTLRQKVEQLQLDWTHTFANLEEMKTNVNRLEQTEKGISHDLSGLLDGFKSIHQSTNNLEANLSRLDKTILDAEEGLQHLRTDNQSIDQEVSALVENTGDLRKEMVDLRLQASQMKSVLVSYQDFLRKRVESDDANQKELLAEERHRCVKLTSELQIEKEKSEQREHLLNDLNRKVAEFDSNFTELKKEIHKKTVSLDLALTVLRKHEASISKLQTAALVNAHLEDNIRNLSSELETKESELKSLLSVAEECQQAKQELQQLEPLRMELNAANISIVTQREQIEKLQTAALVNAHLEDNIRTLSSELDTKESKLKRLLAVEEECQQAKRELQQLEPRRMELTAANISIVTQREQIEQLTIELTNLSQSSQKLQQQLEKLEDEKLAVLEELDNLTRANTCVKCSGGASAVTDEPRACENCSRLQDCINAKNKALEEKATEIKQFEHALTIAQELIQEKEEELIIQTELVTNLQKLGDSCEAEKARVQNELEDCRTKFKEILADMESLKLQTADEISTMRTDLNESKSKLVSYEDDLAKADDEIATLRSEWREMQEEKLSAEAAMKKLESDITLIRQRSDEDVERLTSKHREDVLELEKRISALRKESDDEIKILLEKSKSDLMSNQSQEVEEMKKRHEEVVKQKEEEEISRKLQDFECQIDSLRENKEGELKNLVSKHRQELDIAIGKCEEMERAQTRSLEELEAAQGIIAELRIKSVKTTSEASTEIEPICRVDQSSQVGVEMCSFECQVDDVENLARITALQEQYTEQIQQLEERLQSTQRELEEHRSKLDMAEKDKETIQEKFDNNEPLMRGLRAKIETLQTEVKRLEEEVQQTRCELEDKSALAIQFEKTAQENDEAIQRLNEEVLGLTNENKKLSHAKSKLEKRLERSNQAETISASAPVRPVEEGSSGPSVWPSQGKRELTESTTDVPNKVQRISVDFQSSRSPEMKPNPAMEPNTTVATTTESQPTTTSQPPPSLPTVQPQVLPPVTQPQPSTQRNRRMTLAASSARRPRDGSNGDCLQQ
ncbi:hypothetical protein HDU76_005544 [Blyttiomyces sp. JEL0837]|nr:hypothetical protein HDU76_005544 [Blyttiomyces sp. JEL0837]